MEDSTSDENDLEEDDDPGDLSNEDSVNEELRPRSKRLEEEFENHSKIGKGAFGTVYKAKNKLDGLWYAVKMVPMSKNKKDAVDEINFHVRLNHENVVRYFGAWIGGAFSETVADCRSETSVSDSISDVTSLESESESSSSSRKSAIYQGQSNFAVEFIESQKNYKKESPPIIEYLYIQTEYCEKGNLRRFIDKGFCREQHREWQFFREITEGLWYIHKEGVFHRDLKPENIFLTCNLNIKIGDFGLATAVNTQPHQVDPSDISNVGTYYYKAPELDKGQIKRDKMTLEKLDIYSLGIIFFEMNYPHIKTKAERHKVLTSLRMEANVPDDFLDGQRDTAQESILRWLLKENPENRPNAKEILQSPLLPPLPQEEEQIKKTISEVVSNPQSRHYKRLVAELFEQPMCSELRLDITDAPEGLNLKYCRKLEMVKRLCIQILQHHGAQALAVPLLLPNTTYDNDETVVRIMDCTGKIMILVPDLRVSFVRYVSQSDVPSFRRYTIDRVYYKAENHGIHSKGHLECAFDIIERVSLVTSTDTLQGTSALNSADNRKTVSTPSQYHISDEPSPSTPSRAEDVEMILVVTKILDKFPVLANDGYICHLNHVFLIQAALLEVGVPEDKLHNAIVAIAASDSNTDHTLSDDYYRKILSKLSGDLPIDERINDLLKFEGSSDELWMKLNGFSFERSEASRVAKVGFDELRMVLCKLQTYKKDLKCRINMGLLTSARYSSGIIFQVTSAKLYANPEKATTVFAVGYRYDNLINEFRHPKYKESVLRGAGVSINIDLILKSLSKGKHVGSNSIGLENASGINVTSGEILNSKKASTTTVTQSTESFPCTATDSGISVDPKMTIKEVLKFDLPWNSWDISIHNDRIFVAAYRNGMCEYDLNGQKKSCWQAPSWWVNAIDNTVGPPDSVYTVHTIFNGQVIVGLLKSKSVVVLKRKKLPKDEGESIWEEERRIPLGAQPWRVSSDGDDRIVVIHGTDDLKVRPGTKITMALLSDIRVGAAHSLSFPIAAVAVSKNTIFVAGLRESLEREKKRKRCTVMALKQDFTIDWTQEIQDNVYDIACDSSGCILYLALGNERSVLALNGVNGNKLHTVLPYYKEAPIRISLAEGSPLSLAVLRYDKKSVEVHTVN